MSFLAVRTAKLMQPTLTAEFKRAESLRNLPRPSLLAKNDPRGKLPASKSFEPNMLAAILSSEDDVKGKS